MQSQETWNNSNVYQQESGQIVEYVFLGFLTKQFDLKVCMVLLYWEVQSQASKSEEKVEGQAGKEGKSVRVPRRGHINHSISGHL